MSDAQRLRPAASVLVTRPAFSTGDATRAPVEVLLVERSPRLRFFGGYHALPGGTLDDADGVAGGDPAAWAAARELFEEVGLLPAGGGLGDGAVEARQALLAGEVGFAQVVDRLGIDLDLELLYPLCTITTPPFAPVRFATRFFWLALPAGQTPEVWPGELVGGRFVAPSEALAAWRRGELALAPPIVILLAELAALPAGSPIHELAVRAAAIDEQAYGSGRRRIYFSPGVQVLPLPTRTKPPASHTNTLLVGERQLWVLDPAPADASAQAVLWEAIDSLVAEGSTVAGVLLTHHHPDHVGAVDAARRRYGATVAGSAATLERLGIAGSEARRLSDGERLPLGTAPDGTADWHLRVLATPGHAHGHLAFWESRYGALLAGDLVSTISTVVIDPPEGHLGTYLASLQRLLAEPDLTLGTLYPGHGPPVRAASAVLRQALAHREERLGQLRAALAGATMVPEELVPAIYTDTPEALWPLAARSLLAGLEHLVERGEVERTGDDGGYRLIA